MYGLGFVFCIDRIVVEEAECSLYDANVINVASFDVLHIILSDLKE